MILLLLILAEDIHIFIYGEVAIDPTGATYLDRIDKLFKKEDIDSRRDRLKQLRGQRKYINHKLLYLLGPADSTSPTEIPTGNHEYPFTYELPSNIPSTFGGKWGFVHYYIEVIVNYGWLTNDKFKKAFAIVSHLDLNLDPKLKQPYYLIERKRVLTSNDLFKKEFILTANLLTTGFIPTQKIPIHIACENQTSVPVKIIKIYLRQINKYKVQPSADIINLTEKIVDSMDAFTSNEWDCELEIPPIQPLSMVHCKCISVWYDIIIRVKFNMFHTDLIGRIPIVIGTVPIDPEITLPRDAEPVKLQDTRKKCCFCCDNRLADS